jgi:amphi-Trp domain-containing protein
MLKRERGVRTGMPEEVLFETERRMNRRDVAEYLRTVADKLESGGDISLSAGDQSVRLDPPEQPTFEVKAERETPSGGGQGELSIEFELEWDEGEEGGGTDSALEIE